jgi:hypothetical protein
MRVVSFGLAILVASAGAAQANCAYDMNELRLKVAQALKAKPGPQSGAAAKELERYDRTGSTDEVDCLNTIIRVRRALNGPPPGDNPRVPAGPVQPITRAK